MTNNKPPNPFAAPDPNRPTPPPPHPEPPQVPQAPQPDPDADPSSPGPSGPGRKGRPGRKGQPGQDKIPPIEELKAASSATFKFGLVLILTLFASQFPLPYTVIAPAIGIAAVWFGIAAIRKSWSISTKNLMTPMLAIGLLMALMMSFTAVTKIALWPIEMDRQECLGLALTDTAKTQCQVAYEAALEDRLTSLRGTASSTN